MRTLTILVLLFAMQFPGDAQNSPDGIIVFYTTTLPNANTGIPAIYSDGQRLGDVTISQFVRVVASPGNYVFSLKSDASPREQLSLSIRGGQRLFVRVTVDGFFWGNASEAATIMPAVAGYDAARTASPTTNNEKP